MKASMAINLLQIPAFFAAWVTIIQIGFKRKKGMLHA
jgi:hypothetical protein